MTIGTSLSTSASLNLNAGIQTLTDSVSTAHPTDVYRFTLNARSSFSVSVLGMTGNADVRLVRDSNGNGVVDANEILATSLNPGVQTDAIQTLNLEAATYHVLVSLADSSGSADYTLRMGAQTTTQSDVLWRDPTAGTVGYWQFSGTSFVGSRAIPLPQNVYGDWRVEGIGDLNGDRVDDIFWRNVNTKEVGVWIMNPQAPQDLSATTFQGLSLYVPLEYQFAGMGDLDGDGKADVIWRHNSSPQVNYWLMDGTTLKAAGSFAQGLDSSWSLEGVADFDGNQRVDLLWRNRATGQLQTWLMNGTTIQGSGVLQSPVSQDWEVSGLGDLNGDGKADILWRNHTTNQTAVWLLSGSVYTDFAFLSYNGSAALVGSEWQCVGVDDFNGDGKADIFWRNRSTGMAVIWEMNGLQLSQATSLTNSELTSLARQAVGTTVRPVGVDLTPPDTAPPTMQFALGQDTGTPNDRITQIPTITGRILDQSLLTEVTASLDGQRFTSILNWIGADGTLTLDRTRLEAIAGAPLRDQAYQLMVRARDQFGNLATNAATPFTWTLDTTAPTGLSVDLADASDTGRSQTDHITRSTTPLLRGTAELGSRVQLFLGGNPVGQAVVSPGTWQVSVGSLADGTYEVKMVATDIAGNTSQVALNSNLVIDTLAPTAPTTLRRLTNSFDAAPNAVTIGGVAEANALVTLYQGTLVLGESIAASDGSWRITTLQLGGGMHSLTATATDAAGNTSSQSSSLSVDPLPAPAPQGLRLAPESDSGQSNADGITNSNSLVVIGTAEAGATVKLWNDDRTLLGQSQADSTGNWRIGITPILSDNTYRLTATATNLIGKSAASDGFNLTIDRTNPIVTLTTPLGGSTITPNTRLNGTINGTGSAGATLTYRFGTGATTALQTPANGLFNSVLTVTNGVSGSQSLTLTATDVAGNQSAPLNYSVTVNSTSNTSDTPVVVADLTQDTGVSKSDRLTTDASISGVVSSRSRIVGLQGALVVPSVLVAGGVADPVGSALFRDIEATIDGAGNFSLSQAQLVDLYGSDLADGTYALKLRAVDELGNFSPEMRVTFTFDLTAPTQDITSLIDGITWLDGEVLAGTVSDGTGTGVNQVAYRYWQTGSSGASSGDQTVTVSQAGTFSQALGEIKNLAAGVYDFSVTSSDLAGNQQSQTFRFLKSDDRPIVDQDLYVPKSGEVMGQDLNTVASVSGRPTGNWGYFGPTASGGFGWGTYSTDSGSNSAPSWHPTSSTGSPTYVGSGYDLEYTDAVNKIVDYGTGAISQHPLTINKKAALQNRQEVLNAIAERLNTISKQDSDPLNDQAFFNQMQGVMENLFSTAYNPDDGGINSRLSGLRESMAGGAGYVLAQDLVKDSTAVSVQVFQATLLAAFNEVLYGKAIAATPAAHQALLKAALELGQTYAKLAPSRETGTVLASDTDFGFLDLLWRAEQPGTGGRLPDKDVIKAQLDQGVKALGRSLNGVSDPISTLKFLNNLLNAAANSVSLNEPRLANSGDVLDPRGDIHNAQFIRELIKFGFEVAKVNPTVTTTGETVISEFLNTLWRGGDERKAQGGLNQFFEGVKSGSDRVKLLEFGDRLIEAAQLLQDSGLQTQKKDAKFLSQLLNLGGAYTALNSTISSEPSNFFLDTLSQEQQRNLPTDLVATNQLKDFLALAGQKDFSGFLNFEFKLLSSLRYLPETRSGDITSKFTETTLDWGAKYWLDQGDSSNDLFVYDPGGLFNRLSQVTTDSEIVSWYQNLDKTKLLKLKDSTKEDGIRYLYVDPIVKANISSTIYAPDDTELGYARFNIPLIVQECFNRDVRDQAQIAYIIATAALESSWGRDYFNTGLEGRLVENKGGKLGTPDEINRFRVYDGINGNIPDNDGNPNPTDDYYLYRGRGFVQLTARGVYRQVSQAIWGNNVLENSPEEAEKPAIAARILVEGMKRDLFVLGGSGLKSYVNSKQGLFNWMGARDLVNPGEGSSQDSNRYKIAELAKTYYSRLKT